MRIIFGALLFVFAIIFEALGFSLASLILYLVSLVITGGKVFCDAVRGILRRDFLDEKFLMSVASVGAMVVGEYSEGVAVMLFFLVGETFERIAVRRSRRSIKALMDFCPDEATLITDEGEERVDAEDVQVGSLIMIRPGERVPIDSVITEGEAEIDTSSLTGESVPVAVGVGDSICSGVVVIGGLVKAKTLKVAGDSSAQRILELVENASENKSKEESFITAFSRFYTPTVVIFALLLAIVPWVVGLMDIATSSYRALIFLVVSCPCALVISVPMAFFGGIGGAASKGILFKGGYAFSKLCSADTICFDKTGTLTTGEFSVSSFNTYGVSKEELFRLCAGCEYASNHPIAKSLRRFSEDAIIPESAYEIPGEGTVSTIEGVTVAVGNLKLMHRLGINTDSYPSSHVYVSKEGKIIGTIDITDEIKSTANDAVRRLRSVGVRRVAVLSGDKEQGVKRVASSVGVSEIYFGLTPEDKYDKLLQMKNESAGGVMFVGDGINDAPSLAASDVGIAMGGVGQDSAIEAADLVLMTDELDKIPVAVKIASKTITVAKENIVFAIGTKLLVMILSAFGLANMWLAVFADVGVAVIAILNSMRVLSYSRRTRK